MSINFVHAAIILLLPALSLWLARRIKLVEWLGPVVLCYLMGIAMASLPWTVDETLIEWFKKLTIALALPLLLFSADVKAWFKLSRMTLISFGLMLVAAVSSAALTHWLLGDRVEDSPKIAGMLVGMYSGGTLNTNAIGDALGVSDETYTRVTTADLMLGGVYLLFVLGFGQRVLLLFLPAFQAAEEPPLPPLVEVDEGDLTTRPKAYPEWLQLGLALLLSLLLVGASVGASVGLSLLLKHELSNELIIVMLTTFGLLASFARPIRELAWSYEAGDYLLLIFCVAIGALVDVQKMFQESAMLTFLGFVAVQMFGAILIHFALAALFRIDADTTLITSAAGIFGPPFIGPVARALKNRALLVSGLSMSIAGLAIGTYLGLLLAKLLR